MFTGYEAQAMRQAARAAGRHPERLLAVAEALSGGAATVAIRGRLAPTILFRPHVFHRRLRPEARAVARRAGLAAPRAEAAGDGRPATQRERHAMLLRARRIDCEAACAAALWGAGRAPGDEARALGYENAQALADEACSGVLGQGRLLLARIASKGLDAALEEGDWRALAAGLGTAPEADTLAAAMEAAHRRRAGPPAAPTPRPLACGDRGPAVALLQQALRALGADLPAHGVYDAPTRAAVEAAQYAAGLPRNGVAGPTLSARLARALAARANGAAQPL